MAKHIAYVYNVSRPVRRDKYESSIKEYWVDVETTGSFEAEEAEELNDHTIGEGDAGDSFTLGLPASQVHADHQGDDPEEVTDMDVSEDEGDGAGSSKSKAKVPSKNDAEREHALEAGFWSQSDIGKIHIDLGPKDAHMHTIF